MALIALFPLPYFINIFIYRALLAAKEGRINDAELINETLMPLHKR